MPQLGIDPTLSPASPTEPSSKKKKRNTELSMGWQHLLYCFKSICIALPSYDLLLRNTLTFGATYLDAYQLKETQQWKI